MTTDVNAADATTLGIPRCVCTWKNCRVYQKTFRELHHDYWDGVIKLKFCKGEPESMALKDSIDRLLKVPPERRNDWKKVKSSGSNDGNNQEVMRYTIARHHFTERHIAKYLQDPRNYSFLKPFTEHGAKKYLASVDPTFTLKGEDGEVLYLQVPNNTKEIVKAHYMRLKGQLGGAPPAGGAPAQAAPAEFAAAAPQPVAPVPPPIQQQQQQIHAQQVRATQQQHHYAQQTTVAGYPPPMQVAGAIPLPPVDPAMLQQKELENLKLKEQLESMQSQLTFLHDMVRKLQEEQYFDHQSVRSRSSGGGGRGGGGGGGGRGGGGGVTLQTHRGYNNPNANAAGAGSRRSCHTISSRSGRSGVPHEIELGDDMVMNGGGPGPGGPGGPGHPTDNQFQSRENDFDWSGHLEYENDSGGSFEDRGGRRKSVRRSNSAGSCKSTASRATIASVSKSIKSLPREIELDEDDDDSDTHESLEEEAFDNRSMVSSKYGGGPSGHSRSIGSDGHDGVQGTSAVAGRAGGGDQNAKQGPNSRKPARRTSLTNSTNGSAHGPAAAGGSSVKSGSTGGGKRSSLASHLNKDKAGGGDTGSAGGGASTDQSASVAGTYQVQALVVTDPYGEQGTYTGSISNSTNMPHGYGRLEYDRAGRWYEGDWKHGRWTGHGRLSNGDGDYYEGGLKNDHKHGRGIMKFADGRIFEGEYINGQMIEGKMTYQDGSTYTGTWVDGMRHGKGRCVFTDNSIYEGEFREGEFFGFGKMTWSDGGWYEGNWVYGEMDGFGKEVRPDGSLRHEGQWRKGQPIRK